MAKELSSRRPVGLSSRRKGSIFQWSVPSTSHGFGLSCCGQSVRAKAPAPCAAGRGVRVCPGTVHLAMGGQGRKSRGVVSATMPLFARIQRTFPFFRAGLSTWSSCSSSAMLRAIELRLRA